MNDNDFNFLAGLALGVLATTIDADDRNYRGSRRRQRANDYRSAARKNLRNARITPSSADNQVDQLRRSLANAKAARRLDSGVVGFSAISELEDRIRQAQRHERYNNRPLHQDDLRTVNVG